DLMLFVLFTFFFFFFQAEDGIRDSSVTGVQTCALPICLSLGAAIYIPYGTAYRALIQCAKGQAGETVLVHGASGGVGVAATQIEIGRASCRERGESAGGGGG